MSAAKKRQVNPDDYPALSQFLAGYLHEDFVLDHKTPEGARDAFLKDANAKERAAVRRDLERFLADSTAATWSAIRTDFSALGGAWAPKSRAALASFAEALLSARRASKK